MLRKNFFAMPINGLLLLPLVVVFAFIATPTSAALFDGCDHTYNLRSGISYLESPYYPNSYPAGTSCRYHFIAPLDHVIQADCTIKLHKEGNSCTSEFFYVSTDGDRQLRGSEQFCGEGSLQRKSIFRQMTLAYASYGRTGNFRCQLTVSPQPCDCGWSVNTKIVNGKEAGVNEYPHMVALKDLTSNARTFCSAAIITHSYLLTAAHCTRLQPVAGNILALMGDHDLSINGETRFAVQHRISQIIEHPNYSSDPVTNDIALLRTATTIDWSRGVGPICLPPLSYASEPFTYNIVDVTGWGTTSFGGPTSNTLQKVELMIQQKAECQRAYQGVATILDSQICTYDYTGSSKDSCQYDSGGPVVLRRSRMFLLGCISFGKICGQGGYATGINTRITSYLSWINQMTGYAACQVSSM